jgi:alpha-beta hydrolase superfamily lysophospholipase
MKILSITFQADGFTLHGRLHLPDAERPPLVIGSHGLLSSSDSPKQVALAKECNRAGIAYFRFDHRGCGNSEGSLEKDTSLQARVNDLESARQAIMSSGMTFRETALFGSSMGGAVCLAFAAVHPVFAIVTAAALYRSTGIIDRPDMRLHFDLSESLPKIGNILIFHGDADDVVPPSHARAIYAAARQPKRLILQKNGDHRMSSTSHQEEFVRTAAAWFRKRFDRQSSISTS